ncbi:hypothetical protein [Streptomyces hundungensis]|uniref:hypothetical protein n=1 Tax=Streptomyces hundungensis TaxID=1077946 RepID=UPI0031EA1065
MTTHPNPTTDPSPPEPSPAEASLRRTLSAATAAIVTLGLLSAFYVLNEHPRVPPALQGLGSLADKPRPGHCAAA